MSKRTPYVAPAGRRVAGQGDQPSTTALCAASRCRACPGRIVSLTPAHGQPCACPCHHTRPEAEHVGEVG